KSLAVHRDLIQKYHPSMLELLKIQGLGPKTIALIWSAYKVSDVDGVEKLAREGKIRELPRMGEKHEQKLLKAIESFRKIGGRFHRRTTLHQKPKTPPLPPLLSPAPTSPPPRDPPPVAANRSATSTCGSPAPAASTTPGVPLPSNTSQNPRR